MQDTVMSVQGPVDASVLQWVYPHEHLMPNEERKGRISSAIRATSGSAAHAPGMLRSCAPRVNGLVDPLPMGIGGRQYARFARGLSQESGVVFFKPPASTCPSSGRPGAHWPITRIAGPLHP